VEEVTPDKHAAYFTLHYALLCIAKLLAPIVPFLAEEFYRNLDASLPTVHMCDWVGVEKKLINEPLEAHMVIVREIIEATASARQRANLKLRHPCKRIIIQAQHGRDDVLEAVSGLENVLKNQTNTKEVRTLAPGTQWDELSISIQPNLSVLGPRFRKDAPKVAEIIQSWNSLNEDDLRLIKKSITGAEKSYTAVVDGKTVEITEDMVVFETRLPAHIIKSDFSGGTVYLDTELTPELKAEAFARELIRRIQYMRKELDLSVEEYIHTEVKVPPSTELDKSLRDWGEFISTETRSKSLKISTAAVPPPGGELVKSWDIDGESVVIGVRKD
jgi:isoleucyl-tRNA synthetase